MSKQFSREKAASDIEMKAYSIGIKLKNSGLNENAIYAKLEKQGIPVDLALEVAQNITLESRKKFKKEEKHFWSLAILQIGLGALVALILAILLPEKKDLPINFIVMGILLALNWWRKMNSLKP